MKITELKKALKEKTKDELINDIADLYKKNEFVKNYYVSKCGSDNSESVLEKYAKIIENEFFPEYGDGRGRLAVAKSAISEFNKISSNKDHMAALLVFYVEVGVKYTDCYGDINEQFYLSMESVYRRALSHIYKYNLEGKYQKRCKSIVDDTIDMGWGFHDALGEIYYEYADG
ncbi:DUF6155 family protein [Teredinibacter franksiae]|uniref:DUF6155 family protein n=1 Tax=Teredinibacter franksiae TaxID=2761453 RepID=UPI001623816C|nr:DUF6155 family protein [Teredinibacter franksiae]